VARLIGAPPGYVGYDEGGQLTEAVRRRPYSVILFDEIEKAHPDVFNVMLQILDDGRLTDGQGRVVDFKNTLIIMTSNIGSHRVLEFRGEVGTADFENMREAVIEEMRRHFRPEFLNRVDEMIVFHALDQSHLRRIVEIQLVGLRQRLGERQIHLELTDAAVTHLVETGYGGDASGAEDSGGRGAGWADGGGRCGGRRIAIRSAAYRDAGGAHLSG
jgi:ATP-dependent Clp protease ATP-binding subunit ClpB